VNSFGIIFVALVQSYLLGHDLPWLIWPCAAGSIAGAAMVIVPSIKQASQCGGRRVPASVCPADQCLPRAARWQVAMPQK